MLIRYDPVWYSNKADINVITKLQALVDVLHLFCSNGIFFTAFDDSPGRVHSLILASLIFILDVPSSCISFHVCHSVNDLSFHCMISCWRGSS